MVVFSYSCFHDKHGLYYSWKQSREIRDWTIWNDNTWRWWILLGSIPESGHIPKHVKHSFFLYILWLFPLNFHLCCLSPWFIVGLLFVKIIMLSSSFLSEVISLHLFCFCWKVRNGKRIRYLLRSVIWSKTISYAWYT